MTANSGVGTVASARASTRTSTYTGRALASRVATHRGRSTPAPGKTAAAMAPRLGDAARGHHRHLDRVEHGVDEGEQPHLAARPRSV